MTIDITQHNRRAWNHYVDKNDPWTIPVSSEDIAQARQGEWSIVLTPAKPVPRTWFGTLTNAHVLALASGGGQQGPILAAAGAHVTVLDKAPGQLAQDQRVAEREGLEIRLEEGTMTDLSRFDDASFDLVFHPVSNIFVPDVRPVWKEAFRVLKPGGRLLAGIANPIIFVFDFEAEKRGELQVANTIPYNDLEHMSPEVLEKHMASDEALEFGHTLEDQIGGQLDAGFLLAGFYEDGWPDHPLDAYIQSFIATLAVKPGEGATS